MASAFQGLHIGSPFVLHTLRRSCCNEPAWAIFLVDAKVDAHGMPVRVTVTAGTTSDRTQAVALIDGIAAQYFLADRGYAINEL